MSYKSESLDATPELSTGPDQLAAREGRGMAICKFAGDDRIRRMPRFGRTLRRDVRRLDIDVPAPPPEPKDLAALPAAGQQLDLTLSLALAGAHSPIGTTDVTAEPTPPTHRIEGRVRFRYSHRRPDIPNSLSNDDFPQYAGVEVLSQTRILRWASVVLEDDCGHYIKGQLNSQGEFYFEWIPVNCENGTITVWSVIHRAGRNAAVGRWAGGHISHENELTANTSDYEAYSFSQNFSIADAVIGSGGHYLDILVNQDDEAAKPFWLLENALDALNYFYSIPEVLLMPQLNIVYTPGLQLNETTGEGRLVVLNTAVYYPDKDPGFIYIPAAPTDFGWIGFAVRHEVAHCFQTFYMREHYYGRIAEPLANVHAQAMVGSSWMDKIIEFEDLDVQANFAEGAFRLEDGSGEYWAYCEGCQWTASSGWVQRVLWDLIDGVQNEPLTEYHPHGEDETFQAGEFDQINGGGGDGQSTDGADHVLNDVLINYLGGGIYGNESPDYVDRGFPSVDIVDVLDGMICRGHATVQQIDRLVNEAMMFGYVPDGPTGCQ